MDNQEYERRAALTAPDSAVMHLSMVPPKALYGILQNLRTFEPDINACKKILVYGPNAPEGIADKLAVYEQREDSPYLPGVGFNAKVAHGIIGVISETLELGDVLITSLFGGDDLDVVNAKEEVGDILWYLARLAKACGFTLAEAMEGNIAKLEVRHLNVTGGFNPDAATEEGRDRVAEQAAADAASSHEQPEHRDADGVKSQERRLWELEQSTTTASATGNFDADGYMHGMANGLILATAIMKDEEPAYLQWPEGKEPPMTSSDKPNLGLATNAELEAEMTARREMGHTDPNYRTVDASDEVKRQMNYRGDDLGAKGEPTEAVDHVHKTE